MTKSYKHGDTITKDEADVKFAWIRERADPATINCGYVTYNIPGEGTWHPYVDHKNNFQGYMLDAPEYP